MSPAAWVDAALTWTTACFPHKIAVTGGHMERDKIHAGCGDGFSGSGIPSGVGIVERAEPDYLIMRYSEDRTLAGGQRRIEPSIPSGAGGPAAAWTRHEGRDYACAAGLPALSRSTRVTGV